MDKVKVYYNNESDTMDIWFGNPEDEVTCEEAGEGIILKKDRNGKTIGIEKLYVSKIVSPSSSLLVKSSPLKRKIPTPICMDDNWDDCFFICDCVNLWGRY